MTGPRPPKGAYRNSSHILLDWAPAPKGGVSKLKPHRALRGPRPPKGAYRSSSHILLDLAPAPKGGVSKLKPHRALRGPRPPKGAYRSSSHILLEGVPRELTRTSTWDTGPNSHPVQVRPELARNSIELTMLQGVVAGGTLPAEAVVQVAAADTCDLTEMEGTQVFVAPWHCPGAINRPRGRPSDRQQYSRPPVRPTRPTRRPNNPDRSTGKSRPRLPEPQSPPVG